MSNIAGNHCPLLALRANIDIRLQKPTLTPEIQLPVNCQIGRQRWHPVTQQTMPDFYKFPMNKFIDEMNNNNITKKKTKSDLKMLSEWYSTSVIYICWILKCNVYYENVHIKVVFDIVLLSSARKYVINRLLHGIFHIGPSISPPPISTLQLRCRAWGGSLGPIPGPKWKMLRVQTHNKVKPNQEYRYAKFINWKNNV